MAKRTVRLTESELKRMIAESAKKILKEFVAGDRDYYGTYREYTQNNMTNKELDDIVIELHTICQPFNQIKTALQKNAPLGGLQGDELKELYYCVGSIYNFLSQYTNVLHDTSKMQMSILLMRREICADLYKLYSMDQRMEAPLWNIQEAAYRAWNKIMEASKQKGYTDMQ